MASFGTALIGSTQGIAYRHEVTLHDGPQVSVRFLDKVNREYEASRSTTISNGPLDSGQLLDSATSVELPYGTGHKELTNNYSVRDLTEPF
ncbi:MAG TPA: hypothetical protein VE129_06515 [Thermoanaerobaculia bacterium]|nr:hypothetical protein [Thermoanaerobaculia bacterium]